MKWFIGIVLALVLAGVGYAVYTVRIANPRVVAELREHPERPRAQRAMLITLPDGQTFPVNYLREADTVYLGADGRWWRQFRNSAAVSMLIKGETLRGQAQAIEDDPEYTAKVFARLRPNAPAWLPDWLNGVLVVVKLEP